MVRRFRIKKMDVTGRRKGPKVTEEDAILLFGSSVLLAVHNIRWKKGTGLANIKQNVLWTDPCTRQQHQPTQKCQSLARFSCRLVMEQSVRLTRGLSADKSSTRLIWSHAVNRPRASSKLHGWMYLPQTVHATLWDKYIQTDGCTWTWSPIVARNDISA